MAPDDVEAARDDHVWGTPRRCSECGEPTELIAFDEETGPPVPRLCARCE